MDELCKKLHERYLNQVWRVDVQGLNPLRRTVITAVRLVHNMALEVLEGHLTLRAMSLVYTTLLSLVPLLAVSFSILKAMGVHNQIEPLLSHFLEPLGDKGIEFTQRILGFVENVQVGVLGTLGLVLLLYTVVSLVQKIEESFNFIWRIRRPRRFARRFSDYTSVILIGPVMVFTALGITAGVMSSTVVQKLEAIEPIAAVIHGVGHVVPYLLVCAAFTFTYIFIPNTKVHFVSALIGGLFAGILWESGGWAFAAFVTSSTKYTAIYSGFAILIIFMIWLYVSWLILLLGAQVAYYHQHPTLLNARRGQWHLGGEAKEQVAILAMLLIGYNYYYQLRWWSLEGLARHMNISCLSLQPVIDILLKDEFISESEEDPPGYFPARDIETIPLTAIVEAVRRAEAPPLPADQRIPELVQVGEIMQRVEDAISSALGQRTVKDLVTAQAPPSPD